MKYKSLLLDVDGTLVPVGPYTIPSERVRDAIRQVRNIVTVSLVSGRPLDWLKETFESLDLSHPCVINGGSQIIDPKTNQILWERPLTHESLKCIVKVIEERGISSFTVNDDGVEHKNPHDHHINKPLAVQLSYFPSKEDSDACLRELQGIPDISAHKFYSWDKDRNYRQEIYITHSGANKQHAVRELIKILKVNRSETIAVGDSRNDMPLFEISGLKIAMGNADDKLKRAADYVAPSIEEDGVAHIVEKFIVNGEKPPAKRYWFFSRLFNLI
jgi:Cof subfamily protein (haloacid dehalogenase superfamily)